MATRAAFDDPLVRLASSNVWYQTEIYSGTRGNKKESKMMQIRGGLARNEENEIRSRVLDDPVSSTLCVASLARARDQTRGWGTLFKFDSWRLELESTIFGHVPVRIDDRSNGETETSEKKIFKFFPGRRHEPEVVLCGLPWFICMRRRIWHTGAASLDYN